MMNLNKKKFTVGEYESTGQIIGSGSFATVYKGWNKNSKVIVAIKEIDYDAMTRKNQKLKEHLSSEIRIMKKAKHRNIVRLHDVKFVASTSEVETTYVYMVMEFCSEGDLAKHLENQPNRRLTEERARYFMRQLAAGLQFLRSLDIIHRDLKPHNLLLTRDRKGNLILKIADFGFARQTEAMSLVGTICGSPLYMAPEIIRLEQYTVKADLWSVGCILYEMVCGHPPFRCTTREQLYYLASQGIITIDDRLGLSDGCKDLIHSLLRKDVAQRIGWEEFFNHPWLQLSPQPQPLPQEPQIVEVPANSDDSNSLFPPTVVERPLPGDSEGLGAAPPAVEVPPVVAEEPSVPVAVETPVEIPKVERLNLVPAGMPTIVKEPTISPFKKGQPSESGGSSSSSSSSKEPATAASSSSSSSSGSSISSSDEEEFNGVDSFEEDMVMIPSNNADVGEMSLGEITSLLTHSAIEGGTEEISILTSQVLAVAELGDLKAAQGDFNTSLALYMKALRDFKNIYTLCESYEQANTKVKNELTTSYLNALKTARERIHDKFITYLVKVEEISLQVSERAEVDKIPVDNVIYQHALVLGRLAADEEVQRNYPQSEKMYGTGLLLLEKLAVSHALDKTANLEDYISLFRSRLIEVRRKQQKQ